MFCILRNSNIYVVMSGLTRSRLIVIIPVYELESFESVSFSSTLAWRLITVKISPKTST